jgi:hypothetical protein
MQQFQDENGLRKVMATDAMETRSLLFFLSMAGFQKDRHRFVIVCYSLASGFNGYYTETVRHIGVDITPGNCLPGGRTELGGRSTREFKRHAGYHRTVPT